MDPGFPECHGHLVYRGQQLLRLPRAGEPVQKPADGGDRDFRPSLEQQVSKLLWLLLVCYVGRSVCVYVCLLEHSRTQFLSAITLVFLPITSFGQIRAWAQIWAKSV